ncbi:MAG: Hsp20/alpha crystallin family protein [Gammaproteobacteria bacterium]|nr:Hsp20/alpha crystallin family protein [Gammaproteobacteria bacterium]
MNIVRWNAFPFGRREIDQVFDRYVRPVPGSFIADGHDWRPLVDIRETDDAYNVDLELPAIDPKDVSITFKDGVLSVAGERRSANEDESGRVHRSERRYGRFTRSFRLPEDADADAIRATAKDGVITIAIAKSEKATAREIEVELA